MKDVAESKATLGIMVPKIEKLDNSIDKLTEVSSNIAKLLAVQEERLNNQEDKHDVVLSNIKDNKVRIDKMEERLGKAEKWIYAATIVLGILTTAINFIPKLIWH